MQYHPIPYRSITHSSTAAPISKTFNKKLSIYEVQAVLASYVMP